MCAKPAFPNAKSFVEMPRRGITDFIADPVGFPMLSAWARIFAALPDFCDRFREAAELDTQ